MQTWKLNGDNGGNILVSDCDWLWLQVQLNIQSWNSDPIEVMTQVWIERSYTRLDNMCKELAIICNESRTANKKLIAMDLSMLWGNG